jgi:hypothetical protein
MSRRMSMKNECGYCRYFREGCKVWDGSEYSVMDYECGCNDSERYKHEVRDIDDACEEFEEADADEG